MKLHLYELPTPKSLARALGIKTSEVLALLREERGVFADSITEHTILVWETAERFCRQRGFTLIRATAG